MKKSFAKRIVLHNAIALVGGFIASVTVSLTISTLSGPSPNSAASLAWDKWLKSIDTQTSMSEAINSRNVELRALIGDGKEPSLFEQLVQLDEKTLVEISTGYCIGRVCETHNPAELAATAEKALEFRDRGWQWWGDVFTKTIAILSLFISMLAFLKKSRSNEKSDGSSSDTDRTTSAG